MLPKSELKKKFAADWQKFYKVDFLVKLGYQRKVCENCGKGFWTLDAARKRCPDQPCSFYEFLGAPPTKKKFEYVEAWKAIERFFKKEGHTSLRRYPVVCRWYPLYFNIASIVDFYRVENGNLVFDFPANPLIVPQFCLRFNDIPNVGVTGRHYTCFCMIGQHSVFDPRKKGKAAGYWKDRTLELDFRMLVEVFKVPKEEIVFLEDVWAGPEGTAFGPSIEYYVRGLELGNAVFTEFKDLPGGAKELEQKIVDMGAGLERFAWLTQGTPTSYDVTFKPVVAHLLKQTGVSYDKDFFLRYSKLAGALNLDEVESIERARAQVAKQLGVSTEELKSKILPLEAIYAIADHTAALTFAITDGALPSNVGGGYNLRVILRRALAFMDEFGWKLDLAKLCELHAQHLRLFAPELKAALPGIQKILDVETKRYRATRERARTIVEGLAAKNEVPKEEKLIRLYESEGIAPELIQEAFAKKDIKVEISPDFYVKLTEKHAAPKEVEERVIDVSGLPPTRTLFYEDERMKEFTAKVLRVVDKYVVLDKTAFYARAGGQEPDHGYLEGAKVVDVRKQGGVIVHVLEAPPQFKEGATVRGEIDWRRRWQLMRHHTATHIVNAAARKILGPHVWQNSAFKDVDHARLDITHFESLSDKEIIAIEELANKIAKSEMKVKKAWVPRAKAEEKFGFTLYQGGAAPAAELRIVAINHTDIEACGGTHLDSTAEVGPIIMLRSKRIQDGIVRLEYAAGDAALATLRDKAKLLDEAAAKLRVTTERVPAAAKRLFDDWKAARKALKKAK